MRRCLSALLTTTVTAPLLLACSGGDDGEASTSAEVSGPQVVTAASGTGADAVRSLVDAAPLVVVSSEDPAAQGLAASVAVGLRAPMLTSVDGRADEIAGELGRLGVQRVLTVGDPDLGGSGVEAIPAPGDREALQELTGIDFADEQRFPADRIDDVTVHQDPGAPMLIRVQGGATGGGGGDHDGDAVRPVGAAFSADDAPTVLVTDDTPVAAVVTAVATGATVAHLRAPDPRVDGGSVEAVDTDRPILAFGPDWGDTDTFGDRIDQARTRPQLPGGGQLVFPGRRFVAAYGSPITEALGILGEQGPKESVERVRALARDYQPFSPEPVIPAFEIIGTVASSSAGADGNFTNEWDPKEFVPLIDAITEGGGYAVIDLQPGMADLLDQAKPFADLLKRPNVGLALDPEWKMEPGQRPAEQVGSADAEEINRVITWLADLTRDSGGPQKLLILHQFNLQMITNRDRIDTSRPELAIALHADGHGTPDLKMGTWNVLRKDLDPKIWMAWKNFYDEDTPTFTPEQTMAVEPRPWFVSYQ